MISVSCEISVKINGSYWIASWIYMEISVVTDIGLALPDCETAENISLVMLYAFSRVYQTFAEFGIGWLINKNCWK